MNLKRDIRTAIAWGAPNSECVGYTSTEFIKLLNKSLKYIEHLEETLDQSNIKYAKDFDPKPWCDVTKHK